MTSGEPGNIGNLQILTPGEPASCVQCGATAMPAVAMTVAPQELSHMGERMPHDTMACGDEIACAWEGLSLTLDPHLVIEVRGCN